ncbi:MAG TPA: hypothetical protein QF799_12385 [Gammaproteobacteria bacterium]|nr:hypothetical protein [Gammaproteobacteria bacterium]
MSLDNHESIRSFVEERYFGNVSEGNIDSVIECFESGARVVIRHGDNPVREFVAGSGGGDTELMEFYEHLCGNYDARFDDFQHFVDLEQQRSACYFKVRLQPKPDGLYSGAGTQELYNCNFFEYRNDRISHMIIYYSNPQADNTDNPTGYPR